MSGPLLDRVALHLTVLAVSVGDLTGAEAGESSAAVRERVIRARALQRERLADVRGVYANGQMGAAELRRFRKALRPVIRMLQRAMNRLGLSPRDYHPGLEAARTIVDLDDVDEIDEPNVAEAIQYRKLDRRRSI